MKKIILSGFLLFLLIGFFGIVSASYVLAQTEDCPTGQVCLDNPLNVDSPQLLIGQIINSVLGVVGSIALVMFIYGGLTWMTSGGSSEKVKKGRDVIVWSAVGLIVIFISYGLVRFLILNIK